MVLASMKGPSEPELACWECILCMDAACEAAACEYGLGGSDGSGCAAPNRTGVFVGMSHVSHHCSIRAVKWRRVGESNPALRRERALSYRIDERDVCGEGRGNRTRRSPA